jgi:hypothetical protein
VDEDDSELAIAERRYLSAGEQKTLAALRHDALSGPEMFQDAVALIERLLIEKQQATYED